MVAVTYIEASGEVHVVAVPAGSTLMEGAVKNGVAGIVAECGGSCACGTCRVYLDAHWQKKLGGPSAIEDEIMDIFEDDNPGKRLSCQITVTDEMDGIVLRLPARQF
jgi:ferredoxin, 2Fe-2S